MSTPPFTVRAVFEYSSGHDDDLIFPIGQILTVTAVEDAEWYYGAYVDGSGHKQEGIFPKNFVEKYDPPAPPRPTRPNRPKKDAETVAPPEPAPAVESPVADTASRDVPELDTTVADQEVVPQSPQSPGPTASAAPAEVAASPPAPAPKAESSEPAPKPASKPPPPAVAEKPSGSSFKDRIAAFNKPAAAPVAPVKPGGWSGSQGSTSFIKKPFVAPPPSKNAYVPPPREAPQKIYRREEDPDVQEQAAREPPVSETRPPPAPEGSEEATEDQPKPTSLKERIALLQKQQLEQAARHAEAAQKKEKSKRPQPKSRTESHEEPAPAEELESDIAEPGRDHSADTLKPETSSAPQFATPPPPSQELASDTNDADDSAAADDTEDAEETSTSKEDYDERARAPIRKPSHVPEEAQVEEEEHEEVAEEGSAEEDEDMDPEVRRRMEIRERMAKMSGGMGMMGFFGPPGGMPAASSRKPKTPTTEAEKSLDSERAVPATAPPVPIMALPGMNARKPSAPNVEKEEEALPQASPVTEQRPAEEVPDVEEAVHPGPPRRVSTDRPPPPPPHAPPRAERSAPPRPPVDTRPVPPVPQEHMGAPPPVPGGRPPTSATSGEESDDELSVHARNLSLNAVAAHRPAPPPPAVAPPLPEHLDSHHSPTYDPGSPKSPTAVDKRASRPPPPVPTSPTSPTQTRAPPPPPPGSNVRRRSTADSRSTATSAPRQAGEDAEGEVTEYDGDYDTDIASGAKFKDALKAHGRDSSLDEGTITDDHSVQSPRSPESRPPPPPPSGPRTAPPPPPNQPPGRGRASVDIPRGPPPPPPARQESYAADDEYDPYRYTAPQHGLPSPSVPPVPTPRTEAPPPPPSRPAPDDDDDLYEASPVQARSEAPPAPPQEKRPSVAPPPPPTQAPTGPLPPVPRAATRGSLDVPRPNVRRSMEATRPSMDQGFIAMDVDLAESAVWWAQPNTPPPVFQNRKDLLFEVEESTSSKRGGKGTVSKEVYVLFMDYSRTVISVSYDGQNPTDVSLEQRHEPPPLPPRQDQLENAHLQIGTRISTAINSIQNTTVADGTPHGLVQHLVSPVSEALRPVGTRAYGALVYSNLANASVQQNDEIRAGDIVSFRNARFQGHRGTMHQKYNAEVGKPDHVGIVVDWDGTKKKIRAWEQGRESKKVKMESFRLNDMRSGECKVWRVMPRSWVGWEN